MRSTRSSMRSCRDAAYDSLLWARRAKIHAAIGAALESDQAMVASQPGLIGHHYAQADMAELAWPPLRTGGHGRVGYHLSSSNNNTLGCLRAAASVMSTKIRSVSSLCFCGVMGRGL